MRVGAKDRYAAATPEQIEAMIPFCEQDMEAGALGVSYGIEYVPGASYAEILALGKVAARYGGMTATHGRYGEKTPLAVYALWDSIFAVGLCLGMITFFRHFFNRQNWFGSFLAEQSYAVYIIHIPIVVFMAYGMRAIQVGSLLKFGMASLIIVPVCFAVAALVRKIPGVARII